jgi:hypothetical protein
MKRTTFILIAIIITLLLFSQTRTEVIIKNLPASIPEYVKNKLHEFNISKAFKVDSKGVITYEILAVKGGEKQVLVFDRNGKFIRKGDKEAINAMEKKSGQPNPAMQPVHPGKKTDPKSGSKEIPDEKQNIKK